jgi:hypothetical protein
MGLVLIGVVAGILIGCAFAPSQASLQQCGSQICFDGRTPEPVEQQPAAFTPAPVAMKAKPVTTAKSARRSPAKSGGARVDVAKNAPPPMRVDVRVSHGPAETDTVLNKARTSVAAKMADTESAQFGDMKRALRKNTFGRPVDTICGYVRGKNASGEDTGERPFLYLVKEDEAYVVDGKADSAAAIAYRNICG